MNYKHNIIIVGSGLVGMAFALSLSKKKINVTILEKNSKSDFLKYKDFRTSAISQGSSRILTKIDVWQKIIKQALLKIGANNENLEKIIENGKNIEKNANQILDFTREVKNMNYDDKIRIIETLWQIIYSNKEADIYETNLMRRLAGLLYIDNKIMGNIKEKIKKENS